MRVGAWYRGGLLRALLTPPPARGPARLLSGEHGMAQGPASKDYSLPNTSWGRELRGLYEQYMERCKDEAWKRLPSFCDNSMFVGTIMDPTRKDRAAAPEMSMEPPKFTQPPRLFTRSIQGDGLGFEYVTFYNSDQQKAECLFQSGPFLEGAPGFVHGGAIATMIDNLMGTCAILVSGVVMTANLNINYKSPVPLGSTVVLKSQVDRLEGRKMFISCRVHSANQKTLHVEATSLFVKLDPNKNV
uniref:Acyl-coenzyme A thioesterase THEM4 n=2 Tax=Ornithorhynchus anatinus TaxID=9258 RepID=A0A6I8P359_ORNAN